MCWQSAGCAPAGGQQQKETIYMPYTASRPIHKHPAIWAAGVALALVAIYILTGGWRLFMHKSHKVQTVPVMVADVLKETVNVRYKVIGTAQAFNTVAIKSQVDGVIVATPFHEGQLVNKGDTLFQLDPAPFKAQVEEASANLARDKAQLTSAQKQMARYAKLSKAGYSSEEQYEQVQAQAQAYAASVKADQAALDLASLQLGYATITAPITGRVGQRLADPGNLVKANDTSPLVVINQLQPIYMAFAVPEKYLPELKAHFKAGIAVSAAAPGDGASPATGTVSFIDNAANTATGTITLKATFPNTDERFTPGQLVNIAITLKTLPDVLTIPENAVQTGQQGAYVFMAVNGKAVYRPITTGPTSRGRTVVATGLAEGDSVVTEGQLRLNDGTPINPSAAAGGKS